MDYETVYLVRVKGNPDSIVGIFQNKESADKVLGHSDILKERCYVESWRVITDPEEIFPFIGDGSHL
jgi:hypothetical protein